LGLENEYIHAFSDAASIIFQMSGESGVGKDLVYKTLKVAGEKFARKWNDGIGKQDIR